MSINDPLLPKFIWRKGYWIVMQGRETFYDDETNELITFNTEIEAIKWIDQYKEERELKVPSEFKESSND
jgi:hypothetical protein